MAIIASTNLYFAIKFFNTKTERDDIDKEKDRKINLLKILILDHNLLHYYSFFENIELELKKLSQVGLLDDDKSKIDEIVADHFSTVRKKFVDVLLVVDLKIHNDVLDILDTLQTNLTNTIFDNGINLCHLPKFDEKVTTKLASTKTDVLKLIFNYRG